MNYIFLFIFILEILILLKIKEYNKLETLHRMYPNMYNDVRYKKLNRTVLHYACLSYDTTMVEHLLNHNIDIKIQDKYGDTCMHTAAGNGCTNILKSLYKYDPSCINILNRNNESPLHEAVWENRIETVEWMVKETNINVDVRNILHQKASQIENTTNGEQIDEGIRLLLKLNETSEFSR